MEELENLEETLNESIRESLGARSGKASGSRKKGATEDEDVLRYTAFAIITVLFFYLVKRA